MSGVHAGMTNTLNTPVEALEWAYLMRVPGYRLRGGSGGDGAARGGDSIGRDLEVLTDATVSLITERPGEPAVGTRRGSSRGDGGELAAPLRRRDSRPHPGRRRVRNSGLTSVSRGGRMLRPRVTGPTVASGSCLGAT